MRCAVVHEQATQWRFSDTPQCKSSTFNSFVRKIAVSGLKLEHRNGWVVYEPSWCRKPMSLYYFRFRSSTSALIPWTKQWRWTVSQLTVIGTDWACDSSAVNVLLLLLLQANGRWLGWQAQRRRGSRVRSKRSRSHSHRRRPTIAARQRLREMRKRDSCCNRVYGTSRPTFQRSINHRRLRAQWRLSLAVSWCWIKPSDAGILRKNSLICHIRSRLWSFAMPLLCCGNFFFFYSCGMRIRAWKFSVLCVTGRCAVLSRVSERACKVFRSLDKPRLNTHAWIQFWL